MACNACGSYFYDTVATKIFTDGGCTTEATFPGGSCLDVIADDLPCLCPGCDYISIQNGPGGDTTLLGCADNNICGIPCTPIPELGSPLHAGILWPLFIGGFFLVLSKKSGRE